MNIKKSQLLEIIKAVVRETIKERKDKWIQKAVEPSHKGYCTPMTKSTCTPRRKALAKRFKSGDIHQDNVDEQQMREVAPPGFGPDKKHAKIYNKIKAQYPNNDAAAYATMWKLHKKLSEAGLTSEDEVQQPNDQWLSQVISTTLNDPKFANLTHQDKVKLVISILQAGKGSVSEASYKVASPNQPQVQKDDHARTVQTDPTVNEGDWRRDFFEKVPEKDLQFIEDLMRKHNLSLPEAVRDYLEMYGHEKGKGTPITMREASYKVVSPKQTQVQKDDHARKVQTEPKVNERAYKTQGPSYKTFKDSPQLPDAVNDPENA